MRVDSVDMANATTFSDLEQILESTAHRIAAHGTQSEATMLETLACTGRTLCPGAAEALVDWNGSEITRLRAFGIVHGALLRQVDSAGPDQLNSRCPSVAVVAPVAA